MDGSSAQISTPHFTAIPDFAEARAVWPRGLAPQALREAADRFRQRFKAQGTVLGARSIDLVSAAYPTRFAFHEAAISPNPYVTILNRLVLVRFRDNDGVNRILAWEPTIPDGSARAPFFANLIQRYGEFLSRRVFVREFHTLSSAVAQAGLAMEDIDYVAFDHLHVQDLRLLLGADGAAPVFPNARLLVRQSELDTLLAPHPMQHAWYVPEGAAGLDDTRVLRVDGDIVLGTGVALVNTPGHTDGNMSLVINTPDGIWVSSENGVAVDNWHPEHSRIPGVARYARFYGREVVINANTQEDPIDQYNAMVLEKRLADISRRDARFTQILPSSELVPWTRNWPVRPGLFQGGIDYGALYEQST